MAGMQFEYDEHGGTFYYFLLSFIALVLIPATYYLWPRKNPKDELRSKRQCHCDPCKQKNQTVKANQPWVGFRRKGLKGLLIIGWIIFAYVAYKTSQVELDFKEFDPYEELGIDRGAETAEVKKAYRRLSMIYHPDRETGDPHKFMRITKAYDALTDEEARKNWEEYGNPDGPGVTHFGIALPKWIVEKQNSVVVLGIYALIFMIILPVCVGTWWYRSIKYSAQQVLINTTRSYFMQLRQTPNMILKRVLTVLAFSHEFDKRFNSEIVERPSDNTEIPELIRDLSGTGFSHNPQREPPYCIKVKALMHAHFYRKELPPKTLELDKQYILKKCPYLLNEMISVAYQLFVFNQADRVNFKLNLDTLDNIMKTSQMAIQALWYQKSPLLQLPHVTDDMLRHFVTKRRNIRSLKQFVAMDENDRRSLLRQLNDSEYRDVINVCATLPNVELSVHCEVKGEEDKLITAGSVVTATIELRRLALIDLSVVTDADVCEDAAVNDKVDEKADDKDEEGEDDETTSTTVQNHVAEVAGGKQKWVKKKKGGGGGKKQKKKPQPPVKVILVKKPATGSPGGTGNTGNSTSTNTAEKKDSATENNVVAVKTKPKAAAATENSDEGETSTDEDSDVDDAATAVAVAGGGGGAGDTKPGDESSEGDDDDEWMEFQRESKKENILETKSKETHLVHCPYYPTEKYEWWWMYLADTKKKQLVAGPIQICTLGDFDEKEFRFAAPLKPGNYQYTVNLRSDSYLGLDQSCVFKIDVKEAKKPIESHPQWDFKDDDEDDEKKDADSESNSAMTTDDELSDES